MNYLYNGLAGAGKTTKMLELAEDLLASGKTILIIVFNKSLQLELSTK